MSGVWAGLSNLSKKVYAVALCFSMAASGAYGLSFVRTEPTEITKEEYKIIEFLACIKEHRQSALEITAKKDLDNVNPKYKSAVVTCSSNKKFMDSTENYISYCATEGTDWECEEGPLKVQVPIQGRKVTLYLMGVEPLDAFNGLSKISGLQFQGESINARIEDSCGVSKNNFPDEIEYSCGGGKIVISKFCHDKHCPRILSIN